MNKCMHYQGPPTIMILCPLCIVAAQTQHQPNDIQDMHACFTLYEESASYLLLTREQECIAL